MSDLRDILTLANKLLVVGRACGLHSNDCKCRQSECHRIVAVVAPTSLTLPLAGADLPNFKFLG